MATPPFEEKVYLNGALLPLSQACISPLDRGFLYGDGVFETMRAYRRLVFRFEDHFERMSSSAAALRIPLPQTATQIHDAIQNLLEVNGLTDAVVRIALSRGVGPRGPSPRGDFRPTLVIMASEFHGYPEEWREKGIRVILSTIRIAANSPLPRHKTANYLPYILARAEAEEAGAHEAILLNSRNEVAEAAASNVFAVHRGRLCTPALEANILPGITRKVILEICRREGIVAEESLFAVDRLRSAQEVFLTNSLMEIMPVVMLGDAKIGEGTPGPITRRLMASYRRWVEGASAGAL